MSHTLIISDTLYAQLERSAHQRGLQSIQRLLELWQANEDEWRRRQQAVQRIRLVREQLFARYGIQPDSTALLREDRGR